MAAAAIGLGLEIAEQVGPKLFDLIAGLVHKHAPVAEATFGPGTGPVKLADVFGSVISDLTKAATAGTIPKALPSDDVVRIVIQSVVSSMNLAGMLSGVPAAAQVPGQALTPLMLRSGQSITISVS